MRLLDLTARPATAAPQSDPRALLGETYAACLGAFDGMHLGHQALVRQARALAPKVAVVTFEPRPTDILAPDRAPPRLQTPGQRERVCRDLGVDALTVLRFDREVAGLSPQAFVDRFLIDLLAPSAVVVGYDFRFGARRAGGTPELAQMLASAGIASAVVEEISLPDSETKLGSTAIRQLVSSGAVERATDLLGRLYALAGTVVHGAARGRGLGFPTANVRSTGLLPAPGVYACFLGLLGESEDGGRCELEHWPAVANLGSNPTFDPDSGALHLEVHALDVQLGERLYDREVEVAFVARLRDEQRFDGPEALRAAIAKDIQDARPLLAAADHLRHPAPVRAAPGAQPPPKNPNAPEDAP
ncbi:riboflavin biosynthesis protein RibF [Pseudenhygromyxa sp. WMMC2535]|uniref:riboflavin biosynthesis protein RibF n=1 Tax=Pseudenhygromyxa sp. WMMC2535 TaxID=2712867 RepID=UPI0015573C0C|nr:riboflavin biosynthesis protein RibF [Pseudenhygromyxa sp. WMMC2535]NVB39168.1 riboflavin biosynthesis protein RibF [Pseudenhygromyxa sp. WMMC2535]